MTVVLAICAIISALSLADFVFSNEVRGCRRRDQIPNMFCQWAIIEFPGLTARKQDAPERAVPQGAPGYVELSRAKMPLFQIYISSGPKKQAAQ